MTCPYCHNPLTPCAGAVPSAWDQFVRCVKCDAFFRADTGQPAGGEGQRGKVKAAEMVLEVGA